MIDDVRLRNLADAKFRQTTIERPPEILVSRIRNRLLAGRWSSREILRILNKLNQQLSENKREFIRDEKRELEELRQVEKRYRKEVRENLQSIEDDTNPINISGYQEFIDSYLSTRNYDDREEITEELLASLSALESTFSQSTFDPSSLEYAVRNDDEESALDELGEFYRHLIRKGWHHRDVFDVLTRMWASGELLEEIEEMTGRKKRETTFVCYLPGVIFKTSFQPDSFIDWIISDEDLDEDFLSDVYPYGSDNFEYVSPRVQELLNEADVSAILFRVNQYGPKGEAESARQKLSEALDSLSFADTRGDLQDPHLIDKLQYSAWRSYAQEPTLSLGETRESQDISVFPDFRLEELDETIFPALATESDSNSLIDVFKRGLHLYRRGNSTNRKVNKVIEYVSCLETIADPDNSSREERIQNFMTVSGIQGHDEQNVIRSALLVRNDAVHSGENRSDIDAEVRLLRAALRMALSRLAKFSRTNENETIQDFINYCKLENENRREELSDQLEKVGIPKNEGIPFTTEVEIENSGDGKNTHVELNGEIEFRFDEKFTTKTITFDTAEADPKNRFGSIPFPEFDLQTDYGIVHTKLHKIPSWVGSAIGVGKFSYLGPWEAHPQEISFN